jgi:hypothetical protein
VLFVLVDLFLYSYETDFAHKLLRDLKKTKQTKQTSNNKKERKNPKKTTSRVFQPQIQTCLNLMPAVFRQRWRKTKQREYI